MGGGGGVGLKSQVSYTVWGGGGLVTTNFQLLMLSPNLLKSQIPYGGGGVMTNFQLDAESKSAKIPNSLYGWGGEGRELVMTNFQLLMWSPNLLKSQIPYTVCVCVCVCVRGGW